MVTTVPSTDRPLRVLFADDASMAAASVSAARRLPGVRRVETAADVHRAGRAGAGQVVLVAVCSDVPERFRLLTDLAARHPVIALGAPHDRLGVRLALHHGARCCLSDPVTPIDQLVEAIQVAARGGCRLSTTAAEVLVEWVVEQLSDAGRRLGGRLTPRENDIAGLLLDGRSNPEIAERLGLTVKTVKNHLGRLYQKLGVRDRGELMAVSLGLDAPVDLRRSA